MSIRYIKIERDSLGRIRNTTNILHSDAEAVVNTINCEGYMWKGLSFEFREKYPLMYTYYRRLCKDKRITPGYIWPYTKEEKLPYKAIFNCATKDKARDDSKLDWIVTILEELPRHCEHYDIHSLAIPALGCGNGHLSWKAVGPLMYTYLSEMPVDVSIYIEPDWAKYTVCER